MVSIVLPNLNTPLNFLVQRVETIVSQTYKDWECIIIDGFSDNGSWEYLQTITQNDNRFKLYQKARKGIYNAWNEGILLAHGEYTFIATSDDTCEPNFIETLYYALQKHKNCDVAQCKLSVIDENGKAIVNRRWEDFYAPVFLKEYIDYAHVRTAPYDGILHAFVKTVYTSITQLLIRTSVFDDVGLFLENAGSMADFEWGMRVGLFKSVVFIPQHLATWRVHDSQETKDVTLQEPGTYKEFLKFVNEIYKYWKQKDPKTASSITLEDLSVVYRNNEEYFNYLKKKKKGKYFSYIKKLLSLDKSYTNGIKEAKHYFYHHHLNSKIYKV